MSSDPSIREEAFPYFVNEASDLLQEIEQELLTFREDRTAAKVHSLMRSSHTLKGAAATVGLETVKHVAHVLEDVFRALYNPDIEIDDEVEALLFEGYDCLRTPLMAELNGTPVDEEDILNRAAAIISRLQDKLGDLFDRETPIPTAQELGFDVVQSMFEAGVEQRLTALHDAIQAGAGDLASQAQTMSEVFLGLAESLQLPGFGAIATTTLEGLTHHPELGNAIVQAAYDDFRAAQKLVLAGDREQGGDPSETLTQLAAGQGAATAMTDAVVTDAAVTDAGAAGDAMPEDAVAALNALGAGLDNLFGDMPLAAPEAGVTDTTEMPASLGIFGDPILEEAAPQQAEAGTEALESLDHLFGGVDLGGMEVETAALGSATPAEPVVPEPAVSEPAVSDSAEVLHPVSESPASEPLESLDNLFGGIDLGAIAADSAVAESTAADSAVAEPVIAEPVVAEPVATEPVIAEPVVAKPVVAKPAVKPSLVPETAVAGKSTPSPAPTPKSTKKSSRQGATQIASSGVANKRVRESKVNVRVGLDQVLRLDHIVGELLTNQIQSAEEDEQFRLGIRELLDQLRHHRRTLSDLQSAAQQIGLDEWGIDHPLDQRLSGKSETSTRGQGFGRKHDVTPKITSAVSIPQLPLSAQFDALEMDRYSDLHIFTQKALNEAVQLEIVIEAVEQLTKSARQTQDGRHRLFCQLRDDLAAVRLKPIGELFNRFPRMLQQLSTTYSKKVNLTLTGSHVLVDKVTLDSLYDSLLHLVRNGFDHGIEAPEQREANGKPAEGNLELKAYQQGNRTVIEISDDGQGVDLERIAAKAIEQGLINVTETADYSEAELLEFLFHPGFSTASKLSDLSGRGVGLDVVRSQIEKLDGAISIRSERGKGTTFILSMPLSVTITKQLICKSHGSTYAIAADTIEQVLLPRSSQLRDLGDGRLVMELNQRDVNEQVPVQPLYHLIQYAHGTPGAMDLADVTAKPILLVSCPDGLRGIQVDQVMGEQEVSIRSLGSAIDSPAYIQGCTVLGDSNLALAIEPNTLLAQTYESAQARSVAIGMHEPSSRSQATRLMIIDDSLTQRSTLERSLKTVGYEVTQAEDGLDALVNLKQNSNIDLIVCDLEMPRMNGFEFISQTRTLAGISEIPIVILTSRSGGKYRQLALELGAAAFLSKPYTDYALLNTVSELLQDSSKKRSGQPRTSPAPDRSVSDATKAPALT